MTPGETARRLAVAAEVVWDRRGLRRPDRRPRFEAHLGHGTRARAVVRGRLLLGRAPSTARAGEHVLAALRRSLATFATTEVPRERVLVRLGAAEVWSTTDDEGYLEVWLDPAFDAALGPGGAAWRDGSITVGGQETTVEVRIPAANAGHGVISDLDDTIVDTAVLRPLTMLHRTLTGSALTRHTFDGAPSFYRALAAGPDGPDQHPFFYVSSSPWNLHAFLVSFLEHRGFPRGPVFLRDLLGSRRREGRARLKGLAIAEILDLHPDLRFVLIGDSGEDDVMVYADAVRAHPGRVLAVYVHEVRAAADTGRVEAALTDWSPDVPVLVTRDFAEMARHAAALGLVGDA